MRRDCLADRPAVFLDRDGTLVRDFAHGADPAAFELLPGVPEALGALAGAGYRLVVVSNQSGVARGYYTAGEARATAARVAALLARHGVRLSGYYFCPHHRRGAIPRFAVACACRKPAPGMLLRAAAERGLNLEASWIVGDTLGDVGAGLATGVRPVLLDVGTIALAAGNDPPDVLADPRTLIARNLAHAARLILGPPASRPARHPPTSTSTFGTLETFDVDDAPLPLSSLIRPAPPPDDRRPGTSHPLPDEAWLERARADARLFHDRG